MKRIATMIVVSIAVSFAVLVTAESGRAQEPVARPDTTAVADTLAVADTTAAADTTETAEEIEARLLGELGAEDTLGPAGQAPAQGGAGGSLNPDISLISDFLVDLSPDEATLEN